MVRALLDTSVLFAAAYARDRMHNDALPILKGVNNGTLPEGIVLDYVLVETLNGLVGKASQATAEDFLDRVEVNQQFHVARLSREELSTAKSVFRRWSELSLADAALVSYARSRGLNYLYTFDDDFDGPPGISRLTSPVNPYGP